MNYEEFQNLIYPYLDGGLDADKCREVEVYLESSEEARSIVEFEQRLLARSREALCEPADMVAKGRILANFRATTAGDDAAVTPPAQAASAPGSFFWAWRTAAAAAILFVVAWAGGLFSQPGEVGPTSTPITDGPTDTHSTLIDVVNVSESLFVKNLDEQAKETSCRYQCLKNSLAEDPEPRFWDPQSKVPMYKRYEACKDLVSECMGRKIELRCLPPKFELVGARKAELNFNGTAIAVPHLVLMNETDRLSVYVICGSQTDEISKGLHEIANSTSKEHCLLGCPKRGVMVKKCNEVWYVMISKMNYKKLQSVAENL